MSTPLQAWAQTVAPDVAAFLKTSPAPDHGSVLMVIDKGVLATYRPELSRFAQPSGDLIFWHDPAAVIELLAEGGWLKPHNETITRTLLAPENRQPGDPPRCVLWRGEDAAITRCLPAESPLN